MQLLANLTDPVVSPSTQAVQDIGNLTVRHLLEIRPDLSLIYTHDLISLCVGCFAAGMILGWVYREAKLAYQYRKHIESQALKGSSVFSPEELEELRTRQGGPKLRRRER